MPFPPSVQAGGYNSFHDGTFGLPTLFYPNMNTGMDDQPARCNIDSQGMGFGTRGANEASIARSVETLLGLEVSSNPSIHQRR